MSEDNTWPDPARPGVPLNPERDGWHWLKTPDENDVPYEWRGSGECEHGRWPAHWVFVDADDWQPAECTYIAPVLTPAEVAQIIDDNARLREALQTARRDALEKCILICDAVARANRVEYPEKWKDRPEGIPHEWQRSWETCAETAEDIAAAIRALGEKE